MRAVADSNVVVSGLLWRGPSRDLLDRAHRGDLELFSQPSEARVDYAGPVELHAFKIVWRAR